jgi:hypothetical protein
MLENYGKANKHIISIINLVKTGQLQGSCTVCGKYQIEEMNRIYIAGFLGLQAQNTCLGGGGGGGSRPGGLAF